MNISGSTLLMELMNAGIPARVIMELSDAVYMAPDSKWIAGSFHDWFLSKALPAFALSDYKPETGDCDDFADLFIAFARITHRRTSPDCGAALPVGRFNFLRVPDAADDIQKQKHAIVWVFTADRGLIFIEPQTLFRIEPLTLKQIASCTRCSD